MRKMMFNRKPIAPDHGAARFLGVYWDAPEVKQTVKSIDEKCCSGDDALRAVDLKMLVLSEPKLE
jgi:hypothetical protein